ncbi:MAG: N-acetylmuramoyl-L-alanine amidase [Lachnospiraceae bacterium]|nr:N-acetylmuramoyl-L-alanine amidase [Lachnospiraceae bacterium]
MKIVKNYLTKNRCYISGRTITPKGIMVHSLGVAQPDVNVFLKSWNTANVSKCVHAFVTPNNVVQTLPWDRRGWHAGGKANDTHIGFEICEPSGHKYKGGTMIGYDAVKNKDYFDKVYQNAVDLCVYLCNLYDLTAKDIICHSEGYKLGIATNHADVMHWFPKHGKSMDTLRADVAAKLMPAKTVTPESDSKDIKWAQGKLNAVLPDWQPKLKVDGDYGPKTRIAVLIYWDLLGWGKHMKDDGTKIGKSTREALAAGRKS